MPSERHHILPVWFFVGVLFVIYGALTLISGISEWNSPPDVALANLHAPVWWGGLMLVVGLIYTLSFRPGRS